MKLNLNQCFRPVIKWNLCDGAKSIDIKITSQLTIGSSLIGRIRQNFPLNQPGLAKRKHQFKSNNGNWTWILLVIAMSALVGEFF